MCVRASVAVGSCGWEADRYLAREALVIKNASQSDLHFSEAIPRP